MRGPWTTLTRMTKSVATTLVYIADNFLTWVPWSPRGFRRPFQCFEPYRGPPCMIGTARATNL